MSVDMIWTQAFLKSRMVEAEDITAIERSASSSSAEHSHRTVRLHPVINLKAEIDEALIEAYRGTVSLPFALGSLKWVAAKIIDDRGTESLKILRVE
ncbi:MAG: hypothetical protein WKF77_14630 [Planctomycetaceae bacterium]